MVLMNQVILAGNLTKDPEVRSTSAGTMGSYQPVIGRNMSQFGPSMHETHRKCK